MNGRDEGASACCSVSDDGHRLNATTVAAEVCLKLVAGHERAARSVAEQGGAHVCFCEIWIETKEYDVGTWFARYKSLLAIRPTSAGPLIVAFGSVVLSVTLAVGRVVCAFVVAMIITLSGIVSLQQALLGRSQRIRCLYVRHY